MYLKQCCHDILVSLQKTEKDLHECKPTNNGLVLLQKTMERDVGVCGVAQFFVRYSSDKHPTLQCCSDLKPYGVQCLCF